MENVGIGLEQLVLSTDYLVFCGIQIKNNTKYELFAPDIKTTHGSVMLPPRRIGPHESGIVVSRNNDTPAILEYTFRRIFGFVC